MPSHLGSAGLAWAWWGWRGGFKDSALLSPGTLSDPGLGQHRSPFPQGVAVSAPSPRFAGCWDLTSRPPVCSLFLSWGVPLAITVAAVALKKIGYDASDVSVGWCWIDLEAEDYILWMLLTGKLWEMLAYVTLPLLYLLIRKHINRAVGARPPRGPGPKLCVAAVPGVPASGSATLGCDSGGRTSNRPE